MVFLVVTYGYKSWTIKKAECRRIDAFELCCWRRLLRISWTSRRSNHSILKEISPKYSLERLIWSWKSNTLALWWEELTHFKRPWCWERLKEAGEGDDRGWDAWMASPTQWTWVWASSRSWWWTGKPGMLQPMGSQRVGHDWATELNWVQVIHEFKLSEEWCQTFFNPMNCSIPGFSVLHCLPEFAQMHVHCVSDATQPSYPLSPPSPLALSISQHQDLF